MKKEELIDKACSYLIAKAYPKYDKVKCGKCAAFVRSAVDFALGKAIPRTLSAKNYGKIYESVGFKNIFSFPEQKKEDYKPEIGDISIIQYEPHGHICMLTKKGWISDFVQIDMYGGSIRKKNPNFKIYRLC
jgi:hypothetical protein